MYMALIYFLLWVVYGQRKLVKFFTFFPMRDIMLIGWINIIELIFEWFNTFNDIICQKTVLSLRLLDWLVTNYSKKYNIVYAINTEYETRYFNIYIDYKNQLKAYSKKYFDPFCRQKRISINKNDFSWKEYTGISNDNYIVTTVGQMNFFRWAIENKITDYAINNIKNIDDDMNITISNKDKYKRTVLSPNAIKVMYTSPHKITVKFKH